ncbi:unnamed protein product [Adineta steineri]|uniref:PHD-type domain-containing protein n=1 Tax=Adineta steineri TaxID=433720 RepID=A0A818HWH8_9BILA|nr:unnamed protein product [Adineta steineri]
MSEDSDDSMCIDPEILKKELVISLPILSEADIQKILNGEESSLTEDSASSSDEVEKDKICPKRDQRRLCLLNDPNYGVILYLMDKFRLPLKLKKYPLRIFEDNLISDQEKLSGRYVDLHLTLLKKISAGKNIGPAQFGSCMTKFAYRFNRDDGDHLDEYGYSKARIETKLRVLKDLLEKQFDRNQAMKNAVANKTSSELCSKPFGRDRLGASYWLILDVDGFIRLFREDIDADRTWITLAKNSQELESLIKLLISDYRVRKKFPEWKFSYESFKCVTPSSAFEEHYLSNLADIEKKDEILDELNSSSIRIGSDFIKTEHIDLHPIVNLDRDLPPASPYSSFMIKNTRISNFFDLTSDQESINSTEIHGNRSNASSPSNNTRDSTYSAGCVHELNNKSEKNAEIDTTIKKIRGNHSNASSPSNDTRDSAYSTGCVQEINDKSKRNDEIDEIIKEIQGYRSNASSPSNNTRDSIYSAGCVQELNNNSNKNVEMDTTIKKIQGNNSNASSPSNDSIYSAGCAHELNNNSKNNAEIDTTIKKIQENRSNASSPSDGSIYSAGCAQDLNNKSKKDNEIGTTMKKIQGNRSNASSPSNDSIYSSGCTQELNNKSKKDNGIDATTKKIRERHNHINDTQAIIIQPSLEQGIKRKLVDYDSSESDIEDTEKKDETNQDSHETPPKEETKNTADLPIALRRSRRRRRTCFIQLSPDSSSPNQSLSQSSTEKEYLTEKWKRSYQSFKTNGHRKRSAGRGRPRGRASKHGSSSTTSDDRQPTDDDDDDFELSRDYLPDNADLDLLLNGDLVEDDDDDDYLPCRTAKTVAKCYEQSQYLRKPCLICSQTDNPELLLLCEDCDDAYHLECLKSNLMSVPNDDWYCPLCEHKRLCDGLIEKLIVLIKDEEKFELKRTLIQSKRRKRLTNVMVNVDRYVKQPVNGERYVKPPVNSERYVKPAVNRRQVNVISSSDNDNDNDIDKPKTTTNSINKNEKTTTATTTTTNNNNKKDDEDDDDDDDDDSVYGRKNDENRKPPDEKEEQTGKRQVRSCRRKAKSYCLDEFDKKFKDAMVDAGINKELVEDDDDDDSDDSDDMSFKRKSAKKRARYERDEDFDASNSKNDMDLVRNRSRTINGGSRSDVRDHDDHEDYNDFNDSGVSDDDIAWINRRQSSTSSIAKRKSVSKPNRSNIQKSPSVSNDDTIPYTITPSNSPPPPVTTIKTEPTIPYPKNSFDTTGFGQNLLSTNEVGPNLFDKNKFGRNVFGISEIGQNITEKADTNGKKKGASEKKPRTRRRTTTKKKKSLIQQENISDEEKEDCPLPPKHRPAKKPHDSNESSVEDDDDYDKLAQKRRLVNQGRAITRTSITTRIKKLVGDEDDDDEEEEDEEDEEDEENNEKNETSDKPKKNAKKDSKKKVTTDIENNEIRLSDDDDFPDDQEILKTTGLINLKRPLSASQAAAFRVPYMPTVQSYQFTMIDPTAHFDFTCPTDEPSDPNQANGDATLPTPT